MTKWGKGGGTLGPLSPLLGRWHNVSDDDRAASRAPCERVFEAALSGGFVRLEAKWINAGGPGRHYQELALFGKGEEGLAFWSFTSDGKHSHGVVTEAPDIHPQALSFMAQMPAGRARQSYWPDEERDGFFYAVEAETKKGWSRFLLHRYVPADGSRGA
jgi:hypothetical protein